MHRADASRRRRGRLGRTAAPTALLLSVLSVGGAAADARFDYLLYCAGCHLEDGSGAPPEVPDLRTDLVRFARMPDGRDYLARVPGSSQAPISNERLAAVLNWMLDSFYDGHDAPVYTAEEVGNYRVSPLLDPLRHRSELLQTADPAP